MGSETKRTRREKIEKMVGLIAAARARKASRPKLDIKRYPVKFRSEIRYVTIPED